MQKSGHFLYVMTVGLVYIKKKPLNNFNLFTEAFFNWENLSKNSRHLRDVAQFY